MLCSSPLLLGWRAVAGIPGTNTIEDFARLPEINMGWSGKCFNFKFNQTTGTPMGLLNAFAPK
jgi:hypothetical protein